MASTCGEKMPDTELEVTCIFPAGAHAWHGDGVLNSWPNEPVLAQQEAHPRHRKGKVATMIDVATSADPERHVNPVNDGRTQDYNRVIAAKKVTGPPGPPAAAIAKWDAEDWKTEAVQVLYDYLLTHPDLFTTAEAIWPLLKNPAGGDRRRMQVVTTKATESGWMVEEGGRRLRGVYHTADDFEFRMNKLVPLYRSLIYRGIPAR